MKMRAIVQSCNRAIVQSCNRAIVQSCNRAIVQSCNRADYLVPLILSSFLLIGLLYPKGCSRPFCVF